MIDDEMYEAGCSRRVLGDEMEGAGHSVAR